MGNYKTLSNGFFISLEGPEGGGKSTQTTMLYESLRDCGYNVLRTREPGGTELGERLRDLIKHFGGPDSITHESEVLMFGASRAQLMRRVVLPHLNDGGIVVCDRFADSTTVYQGDARDLDREFLERMHTFTLGDRWPDLTLLLDISVETGLGRKLCETGNNAHIPGDRIEAESEAFHQKVRMGFLELARQHASRVKIVRADAPRESVHRQIMEIVENAIRAIQ